METTRHLARPDTPVSHYVFAAVFLSFFSLESYFAARDSNWLQCLYSTPFLLASALIFVERSTVVDVSSDSILREAKLFGRITLIRRRYPIAKFSEIALRRLVEEDSDEIAVGFAEPSGKFRAVRYFKTGSGCSSAPAEEFALELSRESNLAIQAGTH
jgi:hypothetical protein